MSAADVSFSYIPATMESGICRACFRQSAYCGFVTWKKKRCYLCSECREILAGEWKAVDPLNMSDFGAKGQRLKSLTTKDVKMPETFFWMLLGMLLGYVIGVCRGYKRGVEDVLYDRRPEDLP
jgi:hypothetical protein